MCSIFMASRSSTTIGESKGCARYLRHGDPRQPDMSLMGVLDVYRFEFSARQEFNPSGGNLLSQPQAEYLSFKVRALSL